ncbi:hypothetical protein [Palaeococcus ferrophilus]|uniref:hypothetical protein n=1 Tax=Palaeococcus ferrophilus TaxID=83868 RepID=UPI0006980323|nr:hypothetical protein [Palaeococcus ferrophilus]
MRGVKLYTLLLTVFVFGATFMYALPYIEPGIKLELTDEEGKALKGFSEDYEVQIQVDMATPEGIKSVGSYSYGSMTFWRFDFTRPVITLNIPQNLPSPSTGTEYGVRVSVWIIDARNRVLYEGVGGTTLTHEEIGNNRALKEVRISWVRKTTLHEIFNVETSRINRPVPPKPQWRVEFEWRRVPDSWEAQDYVKVPVLIVDNRKGSGPVSASFDLSGSYKTEFSATLAYGFKLTKAFKGREDPVEVLSTSVDIYGKKWVPVSGSYYFGKIIRISGGGTGYIYIHAKPYYLHEKEYVCTAYGCTETGYERIDVGVFDVRIAERVDNKAFLDGGGVEGIPNLPGFHNFISASSNKAFQELKANGDSRTLKYLFDDLGGECGIKFGVGIPVGAIAVAFGAPAPVAGLVASVQYEKSGSVSIDGVIQNDGGYPVVLEGAGSPTKYTFKESLFKSCDVSVPMGFYMEVESAWRDNPMEPSPPSPDPSPEPSPTPSPEPTPGPLPPCNPRSGICPLS